MPLSLLRRQFPLCPCLYSEGNQYKNNCRLAYRQLSSRDGTYIIQCHANLTLTINIPSTMTSFISINLNLIQYFNITTSIINNNININITFQSIIHNIFPKSKLTTNSFSILKTSQYPTPANISHNSIISSNTTSQDTTYNKSNSLYESNRV